MRLFNMEKILLAILTLSGLGLLFGLSLALAAKRFSVRVDPRINEVFSHLPGANCGACGMPGCFGFAEGLVKGSCTLEGCIVTEPEQREKIANILGVEVATKIKKVAVLHCNGGNKVKDRFIYYGMQDCIAANLVQGGQKECIWGCLGFGTCEKVCPFGAISMNKETGLPEVDEKKCTACGECVEICPKGLFSLVEVNKPVYIACNSHDMGKDVMGVCSVGCTGCKKCEKACEAGEMKIIDNLAVIDYEKYVNCDKTIEVCPTHAIKRREIKND